MTVAATVNVTSVAFEPGVAGADVQVQADTIVVAVLQ
jgi:hypothetical protein